MQRDLLNPQDTAIYIFNKCIHTVSIFGISADISVVFYSLISVSATAQLDRYTTDNLVAVNVR